MRSPRAPACGAVPLLLLVAAPLVAQQDPDPGCRVVARLDSSAGKHALAAVAIYATSRLVGVGKAWSFALAAGANLGKEVVDACGSGFDLGDLAVGIGGAVISLAVDRLLEGDDRGRGEATSAVALRIGLTPLSFGLRIAF